MKISDLKIKEIEGFFKQDKVNEALLAACRADSRKAVQKLALQYDKRRVRQQQEEQRLLAMYFYEQEARGYGYQTIAGVDEAGRGPLAGPVSVAAVILPDKLLLPGLNDSKKLTAKKRDELYDEILAKALAVQQIFVEPETIDRLNILQATLHGAYDALGTLNPRPDYVLTDALELQHLNLPCLPLIKGDAKSASIAAASIVAKVSRDRLMLEYDKQYPEYGFAGHKGYGTADHVAAIRKYGPCPIHRRSFEPIKSMMLET